MGGPKGNSTPATASLSVPCSSANSASYRSEEDPDYDPEADGAKEEDRAEEAEDDVEEEEIDESIKKLEEGQVDEIMMVRRGEGRLLCRER